MLKHIFWILWICESIFLVWMFMDELKLKYLSMPAYIPLGFLWLILAIVVKLVVKFDKAALIMVGITGIPLLLMAIFLIIIFIIELVSGPIRWN